MCGMKQEKCGREYAIKTGKRMTGILMVFLFNGIFPRPILNHPWKL